MLQPLPGQGQGAIRLPRQAFAGVTQGDGFRPDVAALRGQLQAEGQFDPNGQGVVAKAWVIGPVKRLPGQGGGELGADIRDGFLGVGDSFQGLADHVLRGDPGAKELAGNGRDRLVTIRLAASGGHGGRGADADQFRRLEAFPQTADQQGYVGALAAPVGMQFIQNQKFQPLAVFHHPPVHFIEAGQNQLQHHEVGQQDVGGVVGDGLTLLGLFLARVTGHGYRPLAWGKAIQKFVELLQLAVGQGVHRIDDDGARARSGVLSLGLEDPVDDRNEKGQGLARCRARGDDIALALLGLGEGFQLVGIELQGLGIPTRLVELEDLRAAGVQFTRLGQFLNGTLALVVGVDLNEGFGPITAGGVLPLHFLEDVISGYPGKAAREGLIFIDQLIAEREDIFHGWFLVCLIQMTQGAPMVRNRASWVWAEAPRYLEWQSRRHFRFHDGPVPAPERKWRGPEFCTQQQVFRQG